MPSDEPDDPVPDPPVPETSEGMRVGEWVLVRRLGEGAFGEVWEAEHEVFGDPAAIKIPRDPSYLDTLRREGVLQRQVRGPHIARVLGVSLAADPPYVVTELVPGGSLADRLRSDPDPIPLDDALSLLVDLATGLAAAHEAGVIHRDLKPSNVLIDDEGRARLTDFGLGLPVDAVHSLALSFEEEDEAPAFAGTLDYMSPEVRDGAPPEPRSDIYSFGVVLFETLTGSRPAAAEVPSDRRPGIPEELDDLYRACCARREARLASVGEVLERLRAAAGEADVPLSPTEEGEVEVETVGPEEEPAEDAAVRTREARRPSPVHCDACGYRLVEGAVFCDLCGQPMNVPPGDGVSHHCDDCGSPVRDPADTCCDRCGAVIFRPDAEPDAASTPGGSP